MTQETRGQRFEHLSEGERSHCVVLADGFLERRATLEEIDAVTRQLGRYPRGMVAVGARCVVCGSPLAVVTRPLIDGAVPFPTTCYLTSPEAVKAVSHLESTGVMARLSERLAETNDEAALARAAYLRAHEMYLCFRSRLAERLGDSQEHIADVSAGGMPTRVKCLHALVAQSLVFGPGVNPVGDWVLRNCADEFSQATCRCSVSLTAVPQRNEPSSPRPAAAAEAVSREARHE